AFHLAAQAPEQLGIRFLGRAYVNELHPEQVVRILIGGQVAGTWVFKHPKASVNELLVVDKDMLGADGRLEIEFSFPDAMAPSQLGLSGGRRELALFLRELQIESFQEGGGSVQHEAPKR
ncbi:MAG: hypothetical protein JRH19_22165, partial [Deltaproteobacteria bacterium]|nr:hypothetical protein [Deltaproteobacteria bacterium]